MPPRRRRVENEREESEGNPGFTLEDIANLFTQQLNDMMPNIITQVAQALNVAPSDREEGSGTQGRRNEDGGPRNEEEGGPRMEGGGEGHGPRNEDHIARNTRSQTCTFKMFTSCNPPKFSGEEGAVSLLLWFENMEAMLYHSECGERKQVEYASSQFTGVARTWWTGIIAEIGRPAAYAWTWEYLQTRMREQFCPKDATLELEQEFWNLQMKELEIEKYITRFNELARLVPHLASSEETKVDRFVWGLIPEVRRGVTAANPTTLTAATGLARRLTKDVARSTVSAPKATGESGKRKDEGTTGAKTGGDQNKKGKTVRNFAVTEVANPEPPRYMGSHPKCEKCGLHHSGNCPVCYKCQKTGHSAKFCYVVPPENVNRRSCYGCGALDHFRNTCPFVNQAPVNRNVQNVQGNRNNQGNRNFQQQPSANQNV